MTYIDFEAARLAVCIFYVVAVERPYPAAGPGASSLRHLVLSEAPAESGKKMDGSSQPLRLDDGSNLHSHYSYEDQRAVSLDAGSIILVGIEAGPLDASLVLQFLGRKPGQSTRLFLKVHLADLPQVSRGLLPRRQLERTPTRGYCGHRFLLTYHFHLGIEPAILHPVRVCTLIVRGGSSKVCYLHNQKLIFWQL